VLEVQTITHDSILAEETLQQLQRPRIVEGQRVAALRFADSTVQALWNAVLMYDLLPAGFSNRQLRAHLAQLLGQPEENLTQGRMSYQLRRLRLHGLIQRLPKTHRYRLTDFGLRTALFCTRSYARIFRRGVGMVLPATSPVPNPLLRCFDKLQQEINAWVDDAKMVA
jgi:DNA-binding HxlR family transcriptional regulator